VFDDEWMPYKTKITADMAWNDIPPCKQSGLDVDYLMLRGIFMPKGATADQVAFYVGLLKKLRELPEWKEFMEKGAFNTSALSGAEFVKWLTNAEINHRQLMTEAGFLAK